MSTRALGTALPLTTVTFCASEASGASATTATAARRAMRIDGVMDAAFREADGVGAKRTGRGAPETTCLRGWGPTVLSAIERLSPRGTGLAGRVRLNGQRVYAFGDQPV